MPRRKSKKKKIGLFVWVRCYPHPPAARGGGVSILTPPCLGLGRRRMGVCQPRLPRGLEGPRRAGHNARARHQQHPDAPHFRQLRHPDFPRRGQGRGGTPCQCDHYQHSGHRPFCLPRVFLRPNSRRILLRRSERPQHILRRRIEAAQLHLKGLAVSRCATRLARLRANSRWMIATSGW